MNADAFDDDQAPLGAAELDDPGLQAALKALLAGFQPLLDADEARARHPDALKKELLAAAVGCEEEFAFAQRLFEPLGAADVGLALWPQEARDMLGNPEQWRPCLLHIRCCYVFGWLLCRKRRGWRGFAYQLYRYWRCVREAIGHPVANPPTADERADLATLLRLAAAAMRPALGDEVALLDQAGALPEAALAGKLGCDDDDGGADGVALFERLLSSEAAMALLGKAAFESQRQQHLFWLCRCWCLCAIRFGCCIAHARTHVDRLRCLAYYRRCLKHCLQPLHCGLEGPQGCVGETINAELGALVVPITGSAAGLGFSHYVLAWSSDGVVWHTGNFHYPPIPAGGTVQGTVPVNSGLLALFDTGLLDPGTLMLRLTVFATSGASTVCTTSFSLFKQDVRILGVNNYATMDTSWIDPAARFIESVPAYCGGPSSLHEVSFGGCLSVQGAAFVGGCEDKQITRYTLDFKHGFEAACASPGWTSLDSPGLPMPVLFDTPVKQRYINRRNDFSTLTAVWGSDCMVAPPGPPVCFVPPWRSVPDALLYPRCWPTQTHGCDMSGQYTLRLTVTASDGSTYCDTQSLWIDNKQPCAIIQIDAVAPCADLFISRFATPPDCARPWPLAVSGIAYDEPINSALPLVRPNLNFDYYYVTITRQGGPSIQIPVPGPTGGCFWGTTPVGDPDITNHDCAPCDRHNPNARFGALALFDLRAVDALCQSQVTDFTVPEGFALERGECCIYTFDLHVYDRTITSAGPHHAHDTWPVKICNDLRQPGA